MQPPDSSPPPPPSAAGAEPERPLWPRPHHQQTSAMMEQRFICFAPHKVELGTFSLKRWSVPKTQLANDLELTLYERQEHAAWFESWWNEALEPFAQRDLGEHYDTLTRSQYCFTLDLKTEDQPDLIPLQLVWGAVRWLVDAGVNFVLDAPALKYHTTAQINAADFSELHMAREISITFETQPDPAHSGLHLMHTRGLAKFARPDIFTYVTAARKDTTGHTLNAIARAFAEGATPQSLTQAASFPKHLQLAPLEDSELLDSLGLPSGVLLEDED